MLTLPISLLVVTSRVRALLLSAAPIAIATLLASVPVAVALLTAIAIALDTACIDTGTVDMIRMSLAFPGLILVRSLHASEVGEKSQEFEDGLVDSGHFGPVNTLVTYLGRSASTTIPLTTLITATAVTTVIATSSVATLMNLKQEGIAC